MTDVPDNIIYLGKRDATVTQYFTGEAVCTSCKREWVAMAPVGTLELEYPSCSLMRGKFKGQMLRSGMHYQCACGSFEFCIGREGPYCPNCGEWATGWDVPPGPRAV